MLFPPKSAPEQLLTPCFLSRRYFDRVQIVNAFFEIVFNHWNSAYQTFLGATDHEPSQRFAHSLATLILCRANFLIPRVRHPDPSMDHFAQSFIGKLWTPFLSDVVGRYRLCHSHKV